MDKKTKKTKWDIEKSKDYGIDVKPFMSNKRGQMVIIGIFILIMAVIVFIATVPAMQEILDVPRGCSYMNCAGYIDKDSTTAGCSATNQSYISAWSSSTNTLGCTILDLALPLLILAVILGLITKLIHGKLTEEPRSEYSGY